MHDSLMWPIHDQCKCRTCGRYYPTQWAGGGTSLIRQTPSPSFKFAVLPLVAIVAMLLPANIHAADALMVTSNDGAAIVFARYIACQTQVTPWNVEAIEIDASLPKMKTHGRLRAIRRLFVNRVTLTREMGRRDGLAEERTTHISVDTRLVGKAELTIHERPYIDLNGRSTPRVEER
jgi:hypothetical protein